MKLTYALLGAFFTAGAIAQDYPYTEYICETSDGSPYLHHVNQLVDGLASADVGTNLCNTGNGCGETITAYSQGGGAGFMLCGSSYRCGLTSQMPCAGPSCPGLQARIASTVIAELRDRCQAPDSNGDTRAGGIQRVHYSADISSDVKLFTRPG